MLSAHTSRLLLTPGIKPSPYIGHDNGLIGLGNHSIRCVVQFFHYFALSLLSTLLLVQTVRHYTIAMPDWSGLIILKASHLAELIPSFSHIG